MNLDRIKLLCLLLVLILLSLPACAETFLVTSDLHLTGDAQAREAALQALREATEHADAILLLGDSTNNGRPAEHAQLLGFLQSLPVPAYVIPGNHDFSGERWEFAESYAEYGLNAAFSRDEASLSCAVLTEGGACLLLLDTNAFDGTAKPLGGISEDTCAWVSEALASLPEGTPVVACGHHPILPAERWQGTPGAEALARALDGAGLYLCGHDHGFAAVRTDGLQQITVGQPQAYPGWVGRLEVTEEGFHWQVLPLYGEAVLQEMEAGARSLAEGMARGTLKGTVHEGDEEAVQWFQTVFMASMHSELTEAACRTLLGDPGADKWREIETKTVVKRWILGLLENYPQDVRDIDIP